MKDYMVIRYRQDLYAVNIRHTTGILNRYEYHKQFDSTEPIIGIIKTYNDYIPVTSLTSDDDSSDMTMPKILLLKSDEHTMGLIISEEIDIETFTAFDEDIPTREYKGTDFLTGYVMYYKKKIPVIDINKLHNRLFGLREYNNDYFTQNEFEESLVQVKSFLDSLTRKDLVSITYRFIEESNQGMLLVKSDHDVLFINDTLKYQYINDLELKQKKFGNIFGCPNLVHHDMDCGTHESCLKCAIRVNLKAAYDSKSKIDNITINKPILNNTVDSFNISIHPIDIRNEQLLWVTFNT
jgi:chemotaxis signal transduction protein